MAHNKFQFTHSAHIKPKPRRNLLASRTWSVLTAGLVFGFLGMYFTVTRPMSERMRMLESDIAMMQSDMHQLVGTRDDIWKTNDLLTGLRQQKRQIAEAELSLASIRKLRSDVLALTAGQETAFATLANLADMQKTLAEQAPVVAQSREALGAMMTLTEHVVRIGDSAAKARPNLVAVNEAIDDFQAQTSLMSNQMAAASETINAAGEVLNSVNMLTTNMLQQQEQIDASEAVVARISDLHDSIAAQEETTDAAKQTVAKMASLEEELAEQDPAKFAKASANLKDMVAIQDELSTDNTRISNAVETVELLEDFQEEIQHQAAMLTEMRRDLQEVTVLKMTVEQTLSVLKPLIQLSDLRRLSDAEVRDAARVILDRRIADGRSQKVPSRIAEHDIQSPMITPSEKSADGPKVPTPTDLE